MSAVSSALPRPSPRDHLVQAYTDDTFLAHVVADYMCVGLDQGGGVVIIATAAHAEAFIERLASSGIDVAALIATGRMLVLDAERTLQSFMVHGRPERAKFLTVITSALDHVRQAGALTIRLYGEMVDLLWQDQLDATLELEHWWNEVLTDDRLSLLCAYRLDALDRQAKGVLRQVTHCHARLLPSDEPERFDEAVERAYAEVFGVSGDVAALRDLMVSRYSQGATMSPAHAALFALDDMPPLIANDIRARARAHYRREPRESSPTHR
jgi:hypothetical protein